MQHDIRRVRLMAPAGWQLRVWILVPEAAVGSVKPSDKSTEVFHVMFTMQLRLRGESRSREGDPQLPPPFLDELCKLRESHWIWRHRSSHTTNELWTWEGAIPLTNDVAPCTRLLRTNSEYRGAIDKYDCFRVSTRCSKPHSPAESRKARSLSNTWHSIPAYWQLAGDANINYHCR